MKNSDDLIVQLLREGNEKGYKYIYDHHYALLCQVANRHVEDDFVAETIVNDVIFHLWKVRETLDISSSLRSYLLRSVQNRCLDYLKSEHETKEISFSALNYLKSVSEQDDTALVNHPLNQLLERELETEIYAAINRLPVECRRAFELSRFDGLKYAEIADRLGITINTVKYHIKNALAKLQAELGKYLTFLIVLFGANF